MKHLVFLVIISSVLLHSAETISFDLNDYAFSDDSLTVTYKEKTYRRFTFDGYTLPIIFKETGFETGFAHDVSVTDYDAVLIKPDLGIDYFQGDMDFGSKFPLKQINVGARGIKRSGGFSVLEISPFFISNDSLYFSSSVTVSYSMAKETQSLTETKSDYEQIDLIIITPSEFADTFERYSDFKTAQGFVTKIKTVEEIYGHYPGENDVIKIRNYIRDKYITNRLKYVIIGGGYSVIPTGKATIFSGEKSVYSDAFFEHMHRDPDVNGNGLYFEHDVSVDDYPDVYAGRFPGNTKEEIAAIVDKTIEYYSPHRNYRENFNTSALFLGFNVHVSSGDGRRMAENSREELPATFTADTLYENSSPGFGRNSIISALNSGYNIVYSQSHGDLHTIRQRHNNFKIWSDDILSLTSVSGLYLIGSCQTGSISADSFARKAMINRYGGCVTYIGSSDDEYTTTANNFNAYFFRELRSGKSYGESLADARIILGNISSSTNSAPWQNRYLAYTYSLQGDPSNRPFFYEPEDISITSIDPFIKGNGTVLGSLSSAPQDTLFITAVSEGRILGNTSTVTDSFVLEYQNLTADSVSVYHHSQGSFLKRDRFAGISPQNLAFEISNLRPLSDNASGIVTHGQNFSIRIDFETLSEGSEDSLKAVISSIDNSGVSVTSGETVFKIPPGNEKESIDLFDLSFSSSDINARDSLAVVSFVIKNMDDISLFSGSVHVPVSVPRLDLQSYNVSVHIHKSAVYSINPQFVNTSKGPIATAGISFFKVTGDSLEPAGVKILKNIAGSAAVNDSVSFNIDRSKEYLMKVLIDGEREYVFDGIKFVNDTGSITLFADHSPGKINLEWINSYGKAAGYNVYSSPTQQFTNSSRMNFSILLSENFSFSYNSDSAVWLRIGAVDASGYEFALSQPVKIKPVPLYLDGIFKVSPFEVYNPTVIGDRLIFNSRNSSVAGLYSNGDPVNGTGIIHQADVIGLTGTSLQQGYAIGDVTGDGNLEMVNYHFVMGDSVLVKVVSLDTGALLAKRNIYGRIMENAPVLADHDGDGRMEIFISAFNGNISGTPKGSFVYMLRYKDGELEHGANYPAFSNRDSYFIHSPSLIDLNGDSEKELIFNSGRWIIVRDALSNSLITEQDLGKTIGTSLSFCDLEDDGKPDVFAITDSYGSYGKLYRFEMNGSDLIDKTSGGINIDMKPYDFYDLTPPVNFADINGDGNAEIIVLTASKLYIFNNDFSNYPNFPVTLDPRITKNNMSAPSMADFDGDGVLDILFMDANFRVWCYSGATGKPLEGFPIKIDNINRQEMTAITVADLDGDGTLEFAIGLDDGYVIIYDYPKQTSSRGIFDKYRADMHNSGIFYPFKLPSPAGVSLSASGGSVHISWDSVDGASSYRVYSSADPYSGFEFLTETENEFYTVPDITEDRRFFYIKAVR